MAQQGKNPPAMRETWVQSLVWEDPLEKEKAYPPQYSGLENSMDCIVHGVSTSWTWLRDFHFHLTYSAPEALNSIYFYNGSDGHNLELASAFT